MLRERPVVKEYQIKQRKKVNIDVQHDPHYDQFQGNLQIDQPQVIQNLVFSHNQIVQIQKPNQKFSLANIQKEIIQYQKFISEIVGTGKKYKKVQQKSQKLKTDQGNKSQVKIQNSAESIGKINSKLKSASQSKIKKQVPPVSSNWKNFLQKTNLDDKNKNISIQKSCSQFIALDCEFVKCGQVEQLARLSIVDQKNKVLYDSYIKPQGKITDYVTQISGITFSHIKKAPLWKDQMAKVKKILMNKILIGHTIEKDLQILLLKQWNGIRNTVDIASFSHYKQSNGKLTSLKNLAQKYLSKKIQDGWHSSVQDSIATMDLFKIHKKTILKQNKII